MRFFKKKYKSLPLFWMTYERSFDEKTPTAIHQIRFVVLDTETTGFSFEEDCMLSIGALSLKNNSIVIHDSFEVFIQQEHYNKKTTEIHGILKEGTIARTTELEALKQFLGYVGNAIIVAHHTHFDITMINTALERHNLPKLKNKTLDTAYLYKKTRIRSNLIEQKEQYSLDELADKFDISKKDRHTALGDAYITAIAFLKIMDKLNAKKKLTLKRLLR